MTEQVKPRPLPSQDARVSGYRAAIRQLRALLRNEETAVLARLKAEGWRVTKLSLSDMGFVEAWVIEEEMEL